MIAVDLEPRAVDEVAALVAGGPLPCWLVSPAAGDLDFAWQLLACAPSRVVRGASVSELADVWREARARWQAGPGVPVAIGHLSYDLGRRFERVRGTPPPLDQPWPEIEFRFYDAYYLWTRTGLQIWAASAKAAEQLRSRQPLDTPARATLGPLRPVEPAAHHLSAVERALAYIQAGDIYQVNLARRLRATLAGEGPLGLALFSRLQRDRPAPHAIWLADLDGGRALVGNSPERFLRVDAQGWVETCPIKGTRARTGDDAAVIAELKGSSKDRAEHVMIVDLERNDLGRVCQVGSVQVVHEGQVLSLPTVHHLVSTVRGRLRPDVGLEELLAATFPGGSITGAPKVRAMEIIDELEAARRGPYTGATGWLGAAGDLDLAIAIRTATITEQSLELWVGGGIVADSDPRAELAETDAKAAAFRSIANAT